MFNTSKQYFLPWSTMIAMGLLLPAFWAGKSDVHDALGPRGAALLSQIRRDAMACLSQRTWPTKVAPLTAEEAGIGQGRLLALLGRCQHQNPEVDAYIRWRILALGPDFSGASPGQLKKILTNMPKIAPQPRPQAPKLNPRQSPGLSVGQIQTGVRSRKAGRPTLGVSSVGTGLSVSASVNPDDPRYVTSTIEVSNVRLNDLRRIVFAANEPVLHFRSAMVDALPSDRGTRLILALQDARDRIMAGEPNFMEAVGRSVKASESATSLSDPTRRQVEAFARQLGKMRTLVVKSYSRTFEGELVAHKRIVHFPADHLQTLLRNLDRIGGRDVRPPSLTDRVRSDRQLPTLRLQQVVPQRLGAEDGHGRSRHSGQCQ